MAAARAVLALGLLLCCRFGGGARLGRASGGAAAAAAAAYKCSPWRGLPQVFDALPAGGFRRRHGGDVLAELPDAGCRRLSGPERESEPRRAGPISLVEAAEQWPARREPGSSLPLVPYPASLSLAGEGAGTLRLSRSTRVLLGKGVRNETPAVQALRVHLAALPRGDPKEAAGGSIRLRLDKTAAAGASEGYALTVSREGVMLFAPAEAGLFYGVQTLRQLTPSSGPADLPAVVVDDKPRFQWRGLHLDVSRHFFGVERVKSLLDIMASLKLNRFHWHLTDDQGWRLPVPGYPKLSTVGSRGVSNGIYTEEEIRDVVRHAHARHIKVLPEVDVPGHAASAIAAYPELGNEDKPGWQAPQGPQQDWGTFEYTMAPSQATVKFLQDVFTQVTKLFPDAMVHIGGDEVSKDEWEHSELAETVKKTLHLHSVQEYFNSRCAAMLRSRNASMVGWDETRHVGSFPQDGIIIAWRSMDEVVQAANSGTRVVNADNGKLYFDHYQASPLLEPKAFGGKSTLEDVYGYDPMPRDLAPHKQGFVLGAQGQLWSEYIETWEHLGYMAFPRTHAMAERVWTPNGQLAGYEEFLTRLAPRLEDLDRWGVKYRKLFPRAWSFAASA